MSDDLTFERQSGVATITINRPAGYNAMKAAMWSQMDAQTALDVGLCVAQPDFARRVRAFMERKR